MLKMTGAMILVVGVTAGLALVTSPFGVAQNAAGSPTAWLLFPAGFASGAILLALGDPAPALAGLWRLCAALLLSLTIASAAGLILAVIGIAAPVGHTLPLWYVMVIGGAAGTACALGPGRAAATETART